MTAAKTLSPPVRAHLKELARLGGPPSLSSAKKAEFASRIEARVAAIDAPAEKGSLVSKLLRLVGAGAIISLGVASATGGIPRSVTPKGIAEATPLQGPKGIAEATSLQAPHLEAPLPTPAPPAAHSVAAPSSVRVEDLRSLPMPSTSTVSTRPATQDAPAPSKPATTDPLAEELSLMDESKLALVDSDLPRALRLLEEHRKRFPSGQLAAEREVHAVDVLVRLGRRDDATQRAADLVRRMPTSPHARRVQAILLRGNDP